MSTQTVATFTDRYGDEREIHKTRHGLKVKRNSVTPALAMNQAVSGMIGANVREVRHERGMTLQDLAVRCGMGSGNPKERIWAIENATRGEGVRIGTLYALALGLGVEVDDLLPSVAEVAQGANVRGVSLPALYVAADTNLTGPGLD